MYPKLLIQAIQLSVNDYMLQKVVAVNVVEGLTGMDMLFFVMIPSVRGSVNS